jgi:tRNA-2-methylthio-N6-dimethylallyladenosine synthase
MPVSPHPGLIEEIGFDQVNTAAYSPRPHTPAADWPDQLSEPVKVERLRELNALVERTASQRSAALCGPDRGSAGGGPNPRNSQQGWAAPAPTGSPSLPTEKLKQLPRNGSLVRVRIEESRPFSLSGTTVN